MRSAALNPTFLAVHAIVTWIVCSLVTAVTTSMQFVDVSFLLLSHCLRIDLNNTIDNSYRYNYEESEIQSFPIRLILRIMLVMRL